VHCTQEVGALGTTQRWANPNVIDAFIQRGFVVRQQIRLATGKSVVRCAVAYGPGIGIPVVGHDYVGRRAEARSAESRREHAIDERAVDRVGVQIADQHHDLVSASLSKSVQDLGKFEGLRKLESMGKRVAANFEMRVNEAVTAPFEVDVV
jgi:hypothetical protein